jgi:hypothetical protein
MKLDTTIEYQELVIINWTLFRVFAYWGFSGTSILQESVKLLQMWLVHLG